MFPRRREKRTKKSWQRISISEFRIICGDEEIHSKVCFLAICGHENMLAKQSRGALLILLHLRGTVGQNCFNTCLFASDGECEDGGPGDESAFIIWCDLGTDCQDCGPRPPGPPPPPSPPPRPPRPPPPPRPPSRPPYPPDGLAEFGKAVVGTIIGVSVGVGVCGGLWLLLCMYCCLRWCHKKAHGTPPLQRPTTEAHEPRPAVATKTYLTTRANPMSA